MNTSNPSTQPLTGKRLIEKVKKLEHCSREEKAKQCGYSSIQKNGTERVHLVKFMNALLEAEGIDVDGNLDSTEEKNRRGRRASYHVSVQANGNLLIGPQYTKLMSLRPGDEFEVSLGKKHIQLNQVT